MKEQLSRRAFIKTLPSFVAGGVGGAFVERVTTSPADKEHQFKMEQRWGQTEAKVIQLEWRVDGIAQIVRNHAQTLKEAKK